MALVTGIPNFVANGGFVANDVNAAVDAIVTQVGGVLTNGTTVQPGNLDENNIMASAALSNEQKAEPFAWDAVTAWVPLLTNGTPPVAANDLSIVAGEVERSGVVVGMSLSAANNNGATWAQSANKIEGIRGSIDIKVNGSVVHTVYALSPNGASYVVSQSSLEITWGWSLGFEVNEGDVLVLETKNFGTDNDLANVHFVFFLKYPHAA